jgi:hypothetical protein
MGARENRERLLAMTAEEMEPAIARMTDSEVALELARQMREEGLEAPPAPPPPLSDRGEFLRRWHSGETGWPR